MSKKEEKETITIAHMRAQITAGIMLDDQTWLKRTKNGELTDYISKKFAVSARTAQRYIAHAKEIHKGLFVKGHERKLKRAERDREWVILKAKEEGDTRLVFDCIKDREKLADLYPDQKVKQENTNFDVDLSKLTKKGLKRIARGDDPRDVMMDPESVRLRDE